MVLCINYFLVLLAFLVNSFFQLDSFAVVQTRFKSLLLFAHHERSPLWFNLKIYFRVRKLLLSFTFSLYFFFGVLFSDDCRFLFKSHSSFYGCINTKTFLALDIISLLHLFILILLFLGCQDLHCLLLKHGVMCRDLVVLKH